MKKKIAFKKSLEPEKNILENVYSNPIWQNKEYLKANKGHKDILRKMKWIDKNLNEIGV